MRIAVVGAGGTGGYFGGLLARAGRDVTFIARGQTLAVLRTEGLTVKSQVEGPFTVAVNATDDPVEVGPVDLVLFCVKAYDTTEAAGTIRPLVGPDTIILSVQNGIDNEARIAEVVGDTAVIGGVAGVSAQAEAPGVIAVTQEPGGIRFGELAGGTSERTTALVDVLEGAGFRVECRADMPVLLWDKFVFICGCSGVTTLTRRPVRSILQYPETAELYQGVMEETAAVGKASGVALPDDCAEHWMQRSAEFNPQMYGSMYFDLQNGRRLEVGWLNGSVVRLGRKADVRTPLNFAVHGALKPYENGLRTLG